METCIWCDSTFETRIELEYHLECDECTKRIRGPVFHQKILGR